MIEVYGVEPGDVLEVLPFAEGTVTADTDGLNTGHLSAWITRGAAHVGALLTRNQITIQAVKESTDAEEVVRSAIIAYAAVRALTRREWYSDPLPLFREEWAAGLEMIKNMPGDLGSPLDRTKSIRRSPKRAPSETLFLGKKW